MILNNSGIVHCATRTRGREETAMNMQELLTYVEELTFKTSMFGYDKDEVDIQLDKICDEAEAIILAKEKEIEELKKESKTALGIAAAATGKTMEELEKDTQEDIVETEEQPEEAKNPEEGIHIQEEGSETVTTESPISTVAVANADEAQDEIETVRAQLVAAQKKVAALEAEIAAEKEDKTVVVDDIQTLMNEFFDIKNKIISKHYMESLSVKDKVVSLVLDDVTQYMSDNDQYSISWFELRTIVSDTLDKFGLKEKASGFIKALISENLLREADEKGTEITFAYQKFYEYLYAKKYVNMEMNVIIRAVEDKKVTLGTLEMIQILYMQEMREDFISKINDRETLINSCISL